MENLEDLPIQDVLAGKHSKLLSELRPLISRLKSNQAKNVLEALVENPIQDKITLREKNEIEVYSRSIELRNMLFQLASYDNIKTLAKNIEPLEELTGE